MQTRNHPAHRIGLVLAAAVLALLLAGCENHDTIVLVEDNPPAVPSGVYTVTGDRRVDLYWNQVREEDVAGYGVYRSSDLDGVYHRIATLEGSENEHHPDFDVSNGTTYYYAVDAYDFAGHESELSFEAAFDTPRPAGTNVAVFARLEQPGASGIDFSDWNRSGFVAAWDAGDTDVYFQTVDGSLFAKGTVIGQFGNDIQDLGWTETMDDVSWAPRAGWSVAVNGVEMIEDHTYVVWTHDLYFAKFRVTRILMTQGAPSGAVIDWAYQVDRDNPELAPAWTGNEKAKAGVS